MQRAVSLYEQLLVILSDHSSWIFLAQGLCEALPLENLNYDRDRPCAQVQPALGTCLRLRPFKDLWSLPQGLPSGRKLSQFFLFFLFGPGKLQFSLGNYSKGMIWYNQKYKMHLYLFFRVCISFWCFDRSAVI
jgi:hypothetical protein